MPLKNYRDNTDYKEKTEEPNENDADPLKTEFNLKYK